jgi:hypothetical protein
MIGIEFAVWSALNFWITFFVIQGMLLIGIVAQKIYQDQKEAQCRAEEKNNGNS